MHNWTVFGHTLIISVLVKCSYTYPLAALKAGEVTFSNVKLEIID